MSGNKFLPRDKIENDWLMDFFRNQQALWGEIIQLNTNSFIMQKISNFPFKLFPHRENIFWDTTFFSLFQSSVMIIYKIALDNNSEVLSLSRFKNQILEHFINEEIKSEFKKNLKELNFNTKIKKYSNLVNEERNLRLAHFNSNTNKKLSEEDVQRRIQLTNKLSEITKLLNKYFYILSFNENFSNTYIEYSEGIISQLNDSRDCRSDIEQLLDSIAKNSPLLNMPEVQKGFWRVYRAKLLNSELEVLNYYRKKFELPEI